MQKTKKYISVKEAITKMASFCAYQERCQQEVREKLYTDYFLDEEEVEFIIGELILEKFINEERFAKIYAGGKFRVKKWGKVKIKHALKAKNISRYCIEQGLKEIGDDEYLETLAILLEKKQDEISETHPLKRKQKILQYAIYKGYEMDIVLDML
jgi:regulatory protein